MPRPATPIVAAVDFPGLQTDQDPRDLDAGAAEEQVNLCCMVQGEMRVRLGMQEVTFES